MFKQEIPASGQLVVHNLDCEAKMLQGCMPLCFKSLGHAGSVSEPVELVPCGKVFALRARYHKHGPLLVEHPACANLLGLD